MDGTSKAMHAHRAEKRMAKLRDAVKTVDDLNKE